MTDYERAKDLGLIYNDRWDNGNDHHPMSNRLMKFLSQHDFEDYDDYFCWKFGGDGDNGETLMYQMDAFFELLDVDKEQLEAHHEISEAMKDNDQISKNFS